MSDNITLINQRHDIKGKVFEFKDELIRIQVEQEHEVEVSEYILAIYKGKQIETKVTIVKPGEISLLIPLLPDDYFNDRRNFPRLRINIPAVVIQEKIEPMRVMERIIHVRLRPIRYGASIQFMSTANVKMLYGYLFANQA
jgi:hypothetical protein